jgi:hypothetical protein
MKSDAGETKKSTARIASSGSAMRSSGMPATRDLWKFPSASVRALISVSTKVGATKVGTYYRGADGAALVYARAGDSRNVANRALKHAESIENKYPHGPSGPPQLVVHCVYRMAATFEWDENKNEGNIKKHGIDFETAKEVFEDPHVLRVLERIVDGEERWQAYGSVDGTVILMVAHTIKDDCDNEVIRIISARKATPAEKRKYVN